MQIAADDIALLTDEERRLSITYRLRPLLCRKEMSSDCRHYFDCAAYHYWDRCVWCCIWHQKQVCEVQLCERYLSVTVDCSVRVTYSLLGASFI